MRENSLSGELASGKTLEKGHRRCLDSLNAGDLFMFESGNQLFMYCMDFLSRGPAYVAIDGNARGVVRGSGTYRGASVRPVMVTEPAKIAYED